MVIFHSMHMRSRLAFWIATAVLSFARGHGETAPDFQREIRPILSNACFRCHGPDEKERKGGKEGSGGLRLDTEEGSRADLGGSAAIVPGKPEESAMIERITTSDADDVMPPKKMEKKLTAQEVEVLKRWIRSGAKYAKHWSYEMPRRVEPPKKTANPIDAFLLARLEREGLHPQPEADRYTLCRRLSLDLTGLPPTIEEVDAFVNDHAPDAYERLTDRLLASPAFGEHWARMWLDLARYADSAGYADDPLRTIWAYRDYVIRAMNSGKPFDQFTIEQIAGDLLPKPTEEQLIATAFHRNTMTNSEGGTDDEEFRNAAVIDRVNTTMAVWMGTSYACAQCHTHKFDPISQAEYFKMFAFLNNTEDSDKKDESPVLSFFTDEQKAQRTQWDGELANLDATFKIAAATPPAGMEKWAREFPVNLDWETPRPAALKAQSGAAMQAQADGAVLVPKNDAKKDTYTVELPIESARTLTALRIEALPHAGRNFVVTRVRAALVPPEGAKGPVARFVRIELPGKEKILQLAEVEVWSDGVNVARKGAATQSGTYADAGADRAIDGNADGNYDRGSVAHTAEGDDRWWEVDLKGDAEIERVVVWNRTELGERLKGFRVIALDTQRKPVWEQADNAAPKKSATFEVNGSRDIRFSAVVADFTQKDFDSSLVLKDGPPPGTKPAVASKGPQKGWAVGGAQTKPHALTLLAAQPAEMPAGSKLVVTLEQQSTFEKQTLGHFRLSTTDAARVAEYVHTPAEVLVALESGQALPSLVAEHYVRQVAPELRAERARFATLHAQLDGMVPTTVPVFRELDGDKRRKTNIQIRGNHLMLGDAVTEGVPAVFHPLPEGAPMNRLTLARWLVDEKNPLTPRVLANRLWESIFGVGIVRTSEDFGTQGDLPVHPELLDWLATELVREKWDTKKFLKLLVTSAAYRQSSQVNAGLAERDPDNRLLARGPRYRLSAEMVRDQALAVSGLLSRKMYGPSVRPMRPALGLNAAFGSGLDWQTSAGDDRHRRALYTEWRRTSPYPSMATFDAPNREVCTVRRNFSNTPLQALVTMNDPVFIEAAQALARRMSSHGGAPAEIARYGFRLCVARPPSELETQRLMRMHDEALAFYGHHAPQAAALATNPLGPPPEGADIADLAAWTTVANVLLNLDETLMKR